LVVHKNLKHQATLMRHPKAEEWENRLKAVFDEIDHRLEERYGRDFPLHPARPPHGATANREHDGLFDLGAAFSAGFGSQQGPGYTIEIRMVTLQQIPPDIRSQIEAEVIDLLRQLLPVAFPRRTLRVSRDGLIFKIHGDLRLESA